MSSPTEDRKFVAQLRRDAGHNPDRKVHGLKGRPLLDMCLEITQNARRSRIRKPDAAQLSKRIGFERRVETDALSILDRQHGGIERARDGPAGQHGRRKA